MNIGADATAQAPQERQGPLPKGRHQCFVKTTEGRVLRGKDDEEQADIDVTDDAADRDEELTDPRQDGGLGPGREHLAPPVCRVLQQNVVDLVALRA